MALYWPRGNLSTTTTHQSHSIQLNIGVVLLFLDPAVEQLYLPPRARFRCAIHFVGAPKLKLPLPIRLESLEQELQELNKCTRASVDVLLHVYKYLKK